MFLKRNGKENRYHLKKEVVIHLVISRFMMRRLQRKNVSKWLKYYGILESRGGKMEQNKRKFFLKFRNAHCFFFVWDCQI